MLLSGMLGAVGGTPGWLATLLAYLPGRPTVDAVTRASGGADSLPGHDLAVLAAWAAAGLLASLRLFRWEPRTTR